MKTKYEQIVDVTKIGQYSTIDMNAIFSMAEGERIKPSSNDAIKRLVLGIDVQNDFMEGGALPVLGSIGDVERATKFIYNNIEYITRIICSADTHKAQQIFNQCWWVNSKGENPKPYTIITEEDVIEKRWMPVFGDPSISIEYVKKLASLGKKQLCIWPYHTIKGTPGANLEGQFAKMVYFHSLVRKSENSIILKGEDSYSEMYGAIKPEYSREKIINMEILTAVEEADEIYLLGEAESHCLMETLIQILHYYAECPNFGKKLYVLVDCTSPISGYEDYTAKTFADLRKKYGVNFVKSTDIHFNY